MTTPILTKGTAMTPNAVTAGNNWQVSNGGFSILQLLQGSSVQDFVYGQKITAPAVTGPLTFTFAGFTPSASQYLYGFLLEVTAVHSTNNPVAANGWLLYPSFNLKTKVTTTPVATKTLYVPANNLNTATDSYWPAPTPSNTLGEFKQIFVYTFDTTIPKWDLSSITIEASLPDLPMLITDFSIGFRKWTISPLYFTPTVFPPTITDPAHTWKLFFPQPYTNNSGGLAAPALFSQSFVPADLQVDFPDIVKVREHTGTTASDGVLQEHLIVPRREDNSYLIGRIPLLNTDTSTRPVSKISMASGWLIPATGQYAWGDWSQIDPRVVATRPVVPVLTGAINGDQVDLTAYSCDNLLSTLYSGILGAVDLTAMDPAQPTVAASNAASWTAAYDTNQRTNQVLRLTRQTTSGVITVSMPHVPVQAGKTYAASLFFRTSVATTTQININWYDSADALLSSSTNIASNNQTSRTLLQGTATAPANAVYAQLQIQTGSIAAGSTLDLDSISFNRYNGASVPNFNQGGHIWGNAAWLLGSAKPLTASAFGVAAGAPFFVEEDNPTNVSLVTEVTTAPRTGTHHLQYAATDNSVLVLYANRHMLPEAFPSGKLTVSVRAWIRSVTTQGQCAIGLRFIDRDGNPVGDDFYGTNALTSTSTYAVYKCSSVVVPDGTVQIAVLVAFHTNSAITYYLDDFAMIFGTLPSDNVVVPGYYSASGYPSDGGVGFIVIERQLAGSSTWTPIAISQVNPSTDFTYSDYVVPEGMTFKYRARVLGLLDGQLEEGQYSAELSLNTTSPGLQWTLWDPSDDTKGPLRFDLNADDPVLNVQLLSSLALYAPVGRNRRVLTKDTSKGRVFQLNVDSIDLTQLALWETYHRDRNVLILTRTSTGECWPVVLSGDLQVAILNTTPTRFLIQTTAEEIDVVPVW